MSTAVVVDAIVLLSSLFPRRRRWSVHGREVLVALAVCFFVVDAVGRFCHSFLLLLAHTLSRHSTALRDNDARITSHPRGWTTAVAIPTYIL